MKYSILLVVLLIACGTVQPIVTVPQSQTVPSAVAETVYVRDMGEYGTGYGGECDTASILALYCKGEVSGADNGMSWRFLYETERVKADSLGKVKSRVIVRVVRDSIVVPIPQVLTDELARLKDENGRQAIELAKANTLKWKLYIVIGILSLVFLAVVGTLIKKLRKRTDIWPELPFVGGPRP